MALPQEALDNAVLIVAHPDDEVLWFSSILDAVKSIVIVFMDSAHHPERGDARRAAISEHRFRDKILSLDVEQVRSRDASDWPCPEETDYGLRLARRPELDAAYAGQAKRVTAALAPLLAGAGNVFTHNPWGEYGHEDHVQLSKVATRLAFEAGATVWYDNYVSGKSSRLMRRYLGRFTTNYFAMPVDSTQARRIASSYMTNGAWTFEDDYVWFPSECFVQGPLECYEEPANGTLFPVNYIRVPFDPVPASSPPPGLLQRLHRKLKRVASHAATH